MGIYIDDCDSGDTIEGNIFRRAGRAIMIGGGRDNIVQDNLVIDCPVGIQLDARGTILKQWNNPNDPSWYLEGKAKDFNYTTPPWSERYPKLARIMQEDPQWPLGNVIRNNIFVDCSKKVYDLDKNTYKILSRLDIAANIVVNLGGRPAMPTAEDIQGFQTIIATRNQPVVPVSRKSNGSSSLHKIAHLYAFQPVAKIPPIERIGLLKDVYRRSVKYLTLSSIHCH